MTPIWPVALASIVMAAGLDVGEWLSDDSKREVAASDPAKCWCDQLTAMVSDRIAKADEEIQTLESAAKIAHYENERLKLEVQDHKSEVAEHSSSLGSASAISDREAASAQDEVSQLESSLSTIRKAMEKVTEGSQIHGALKGLESTFSDKLKEAQQADKTRSADFDDLQESKEKMMKLAREAAAAKEARLANGLAAVSRANAQIERYSAQRDDDVALRAATQDLCDMLSDQREKREHLRQASNIAVSQAKVDAAQEAAMQAAAKVVTTLLSRRSRGLRIHAHRASSNSTIKAVRRHLDCATELQRAEDDKRRATEALERAKKGAAELMALTDKSGGIQNSLETMLHTSMSGSLLAEGGSSGEVKASFGAIFDAVKADLASLAPPFDALRAKGKASILAASRVVTVLMEVEADASQAVVDARRCEA